MLPRKRRPSRHIESNNESFHPHTPKDYFRHQYYEALDILIAELNRRFIRKNLSVLQEIEDILISACKNVLKKPSDELVRMYSSIIDFKRLAAQISMMPDLIKAANNDGGGCIKEVTMIRTICNIINDVF